MAEAYSSYVTEWHGGKTRAYIKGWIESETDKTATIYVWGCAQANRLTQYGVRIRVYINGTQVNTTTANIFSASSVTNVGGISGRATITKSSSSQNITIACAISGATVNGYGPIGGSATASTSVSVGVWVLRPPSAPSALTAARNAAANIDLTWTNNATNAASTLVERCMKGGSWATILDRGSVITSYTDSPGIGSFKYRVRYWNSDGFSGYSNETDYIVTLCPPAAPTLISPASGAMVDANRESVKVIWQHNAIDSSAQTEAEISWSKDNIAFETATVAQENYYQLPIEGENEAIYWMVRTKGADVDYGPTSGVSHFLVRTAPVAILSVPSLIENLPIPLSWEYEDAMGTQISALLEVLTEDEQTVFSKTLASENSYTILASEFTPEHEKTYLIRLTVVSTTSLSYSTQAAVTVNYVSPVRPNIAVATNLRRAENVITVFEGTGIENAPQTAFISVFRDGMLLAERLHPGGSVTDGTPPLDRRITYTAVAYTESGAAAMKNEITVVNSNGFAFFNFGDQVAKLGMNISITDITRNEKECYVTSASKYPKVFYGEHSERSGSISADVFWAYDALDYGEEAMLSAIEDLKEHTGLITLRLPYSDTFTVDVDVSEERSTSAYNIAKVSIDWRRVD